MEATPSARLLVLAGTERDDIVRATILNRGAR